MNVTYDDGAQREMQNARFARGSARPSDFYSDAWWALGLLMAWRVAAGHYKLPFTSVQPQETVLVGLVQEHVEDVLRRARAPAIVADDGELHSAARRRAPRGTVSPLRTTCGDVEAMAEDQVEPDALSVDAQWVYGSNAEMSAA